MTAQATGVKRFREEAIDFASLPDAAPLNKKQKTSESSESSSSSNASNNSEPPQRQSSFLPFGQAVEKVLQYETEGYELKKAGKYADAIKKFVEAVKSSGVTPQTKIRLWTHIGNSRCELGEIDKAIVCYRNAIKDGASCSDTLLKLRVAYNLAGTLISRRQPKDIEEAIELLKSILPSAQFLVKYDKSLLEKIFADLSYALLVRNTASDAQEIVKYAHAGLSLNPENPDIRASLFSNLGDGLALLGKEQDAIRYYEKAMAMPQVTEEYLTERLAKNYVKSFNIFVWKLRSNLENIRSREEPSPERAFKIAIGLHQLGMVLLKRKLNGDQAVAIQCFQRALLEEFNNPAFRAELCRELGDQLLGQNAKENAIPAIKCFLEGLKLLSSSDSKLRFELLLNLALAYAANDDRANAIKCLQTALLAYNCSSLDKVKILFQIGKLYMSIKENQRAAEHLKKAFELAQGDLVLRGQIQFHLNQLEPAHASS